jgi:fluoride exporter
MTVGLFLATVLAGALGAMARAAVGLLLGSQGTLAVNLAGAFALGLLWGSADAVGSNWLLVAGTGFLGAFTTFSTWMVELHGRWRPGARRRLLVEAAATLVAGAAAVLLGASLPSLG